MDDAKMVSSFLGGWVVTNVPASGYKQEGDVAQAAALADTCVALAAAQHITRADLEALVGDLTEHIRKAQNIAQHAAESPKKLHPSRTAN